MTTDTSRISRRRWPDAARRGGRDRRLRAEAHRFVPQAFYNTFSGAHPPALRIKSGDRVMTTTVDEQGRRR